MIAQASIFDGLSDSVLLVVLVKALVVVGFFLVAPLLVVAVVSINANRYMDFPPEGFSLAWYGQMVADVAWRSAILRSLFIAATSAATWVTWRARWPTTTWPAKKVRPGPR